MVEYYLDNTGVVEVLGIEKSPKYASMGNGTILIPPSEDEPLTTLEVMLSNPRNLTIRQELLGVPEGKKISSRQAEKGIAVAIEGAVLDDDYDLTLAMQSPDGLRDFAPYPMRIRCVAFNTALSDFRVNKLQPELDQGRYGFTVELLYETATVTLEGTAVEPTADLKLYQGQAAAGTPIASGTGKAGASAALNAGDNHFYLVVSTPGASQGYTITIIRGQAPNTSKDSGKEITAFSITAPVNAIGTVDETLKTITVNVPYGTSLTAMTASVSHTGASISPDPMAAKSYAAPVTYTVTAEDGTSQQYTVTVTYGPGITISGIPVDGLPKLTFSGEPDDPVVEPGTSIAITISGGPVTGWYIYINGLVSPTGFTDDTVTFAAPETPGSYNVTVIATVGGVDYSGSFGLVVK
ncbi:MAG: DUF5018 domain-containing protein [Spirochaetaceae bacterium]|jgi:hypothetical protein|nr:DUF5018 domain-containing protein [Spirochaetaceae bacterium]